MTVVNAREADVQGANLDAKGTARFGGARRVDGEADEGLVRARDVAVVVVTRGEGGRERRGEDEDRKPGGSHVAPFRSPRGLRELSNGGARPGVVLAADAARLPRVLT